MQNGTVLLNLESKLDVRVLVIQIIKKLFKFGT